VGALFSSSFNPSFRGGHRQSPCSPFFFPPPGLRFKSHRSFPFMKELFFFGGSPAFFSLPLLSLKAITPGAGFFYRLKNAPFSLLAIGSFSRALTRAFFFTPTSIPLFLANFSPYDKRLPPPSPRPRSAILVPPIGRLLHRRQFSSLFLSL